MACFRATIKGTRGPSSRLGHKSSGITATINGWHKGILVVAAYDPKTDRDTFTIYTTGGSTNPSSHTKIYPLPNTGD